MVDIKDLYLDELEKVLKDWSQPSFRARQIFSWLYHKGVQDFDKMNDLPLGLRSKLKEEFSLSVMRVTNQFKSNDGTEKLLFELKDGNCIEAVVIPTKSRVTGCVSVQVGCRFGCRFCASGALGFKRNLTTGEIIEEAFYLKYYSKAKRLTHLVFMGTGEPLDNYDNVLRAIRIINSDYSFNLGARRITISTVGIIPAIAKLSNFDLQIELSVSLHAADDESRSFLVPANKRYPLKELISACRRYTERTNRQITFEYILIKD
ncbi:MAG: 23S rRNA (adenine(2503)-C(2))-methyltransferase RlmN, partial [Candidatus Omnitrophica bacterium]|nr:23S rRNA (adenine(2503)-C(2))-methyltransferase RlmN [Candidatus Omnitrophota bacterium]